MGSTSGSLFIIIKTFLPEFDYKVILSVSAFFKGFEDHASSSTISNTYISIVKMLDFPFSGHQREKLEVDRPPLFVTSGAPFFLQYLFMF